MARYSFAVLHTVSNRNHSYCRPILKYLLKTLPRKQVQGTSLFRSVASWDPSEVELQVRFRRELILIRTMTLGTLIPMTMYTLDNERRLLCVASVVTVNISYTQSVTRSLLVI